jgi:adenylylsulfate kinase-like enzyme
VTTPSAVLLRAPVGGGKTTVAATLNWVLSEHDVAHAVLELDWLSSSWPRIGQWNRVLRTRNLQAVTTEYRAVGIERFVVAGVVELREEIDEITDAIGVPAITVCGLRAPVSVLTERVTQRDTGRVRQWHVDRAAVLAAQMANDGLDDLVVDTEGKDHEAVAREIATRVGWI